MSLREKRYSKALVRCEQDLNLRGNNPLGFEPNALTTRPSQLAMQGAPIFHICPKQKESYKRHLQALSTIILSTPHTPVYWTISFQ